MKRLAYISILLVLSYAGFAQNSSINKRVNLKLGISNTTQKLGQSNDLLFKKLTFETNYGWLSFIESGPYVSFYNSEIIYLPNSNGSASNSTYRTSESLIIGINTNIHLMPFIFKSGRIRFDTYLSGKLGLASFSVSNSFRYQGLFPNYWVNVGAAYYLTSKWGFYIEYGIGKSVKLSGIEKALWYGISMKF